MGKNFLKSKRNNLESSEQTEKYIKEMYSMADKSEHRSTIAFIAVAIPILIVFIVTIAQMISFTVGVAQSKNSEKIQIVSNDSSSSEANKNSEDVSDESLNAKVYDYLKDKKNRDASLENAIELNNGSTKGLSSIFIAQILRDNGYDIEKSVINTEKFVSALENLGWEKVSDYNKLQPGDVCFTVNSKSSNSPSHTYIFMDWVEEGKTDFAYIVDSQISEYDDTYHKRNIDAPTTKKDEFSFFMRKK